MLLIMAWQIDRNFYHPYLPDLETQIHKDVTTTKIAIPKDEQSCLAQNGTWKKMGIRPVASCNLPTQDGGKSCTSSDNCEGVCLADLTNEELREGMKGRLFKTDGQCSDWLIVLGCKAYVYKGWAQVVCSD